LDEDISRPRYMERKGEGLHPAVVGKRLNMIYIYICMFATIAIAMFGRVCSNE